MNEPAGARDVDGGSEDMTLAFELDALRSLAKPSTVFANARQWTGYVGVVSAEPTYVVTNYARKHRIRQDFFSGPDGKEASLESIKEQFDTERYVFVGTEETDRELAERIGWEYIDLDEAAEAAGWEVAEDPAPEDAGERDDWP